MNFNFRGGKPQQKEENEIDTEQLSAAFDGIAKTLSSIDNRLTALETPSKREEPKTEPAVDKAATDAAEIANMCSEAGFGNLAAAFIREENTVAEVRTRLSECKNIRSAVAVARKSNASLPNDLTDQYIEKEMSLEDVRADLLDKSTSSQEENHVDGIITGNSNNSPSEQAAIDKGWGEAVAKVHPELKAA